MLRTALLGLLLTGCVVGEDGNGLPVSDPDPDPDPMPEPDAPTGTIMMSATTVAQGTAGGFAPANALAVWVEDSQGNFVKTIDRQALGRQSNLVAWVTAAGPGDLDSVSGASRIDHATPISFMWKMKDRNKQPIPDGTYTIRMEVAETNATSAAQNQQGTFTFIAGPAPQNQTGLASGGITNVSISFTPPPP
jgi:hypothetical protein